MNTTLEAQLTEKATADATTLKADGLTAADLETFTPAAVFKNWLDATAGQLDGLDDEEVDYLYGRYLDALTTALEA